MEGTEVSIQHIMVVDIQDIRVIQDTDIQDMAAIGVTAATVIMEDGVTAAGVMVAGAEAGDHGAGVEEDMEDSHLAADFQAALAFQAILIKTESQIGWKVADGVITTGIIIDIIIIQAAGVE